MEALAAVAVATSPGETEDLKRIAKLPLSNSDLADVKYDIDRILIHSARIRDELIEINPLWAGFSTSEIEALGHPATFTLP